MEHYLDKHEVTTTADKNDDDGKNENTTYKHDTRAERALEQTLLGEFWICLTKEFLGSLQFWICSKNELLQFLQVVVQWASAARAAPILI